MLKTSCLRVRFPLLARWYDAGMNTLFLILLILSILCFAAAAFGKAVGTINLVAFGLMFWVAVPLITMIAAL